MLVPLPEVLPLPTTMPIEYKDLSLLFPAPPLHPQPAATILAITLTLFVIAYSMSPLSSLVASSTFLFPNPTPSSSPSGGQKFHVPCILILLPVPEILLPPQSLQQSSVHMQFMRLGFKRLLGGGPNLLSMVPLSWLLAYLPNSLEKGWRGVF